MKRMYKVDQYEVSSLHESLSTAINGDDRDGCIPRRVSYALRRRLRALASRRRHAILGHGHTPPDRTAPRTLPDQAWHTLKPAPVRAQSYAPLWPQKGPKQTFITSRYVLSEYWRLMHKMKGRHQFRRRFSLQPSFLKEEHDDERRPHR